MRRSGVAQIFDGFHKLIRRLPAINLAALLLHRSYNMVGAQAHVLVHNLLEKGVHLTARTQHAKPATLQQRLHRTLVIVPAHSRTHSTVRII